MSDDFGPRYYKLIGRLPVPASMDDWAKRLEMPNRRVALTRIGEIEISTVFLGLDHNHSHSGPPAIFETMVFGAAREEMGGYQTRCATWDEAEKMHAEAVALAQAWTDRATRDVRATSPSVKGSAS